MTSLSPSPEATPPRSPRNRTIANATGLASPTQIVKIVGRKLLTNSVIFDYASTIYAAMTNNPYWLHNSSRLLERVPTAENGRVRVLDLGAGPGNSAASMGQARPDADFVTLDLAPQMVRLAAQTRRRLGWSIDRFSPLLGDAVRLPLADASVHAVTAHSFLYLLPNRAAVLDEIERVLRPGGELAVLEPRSGRVDWLWLWLRSDPGLIFSLSLWRVYSWVHDRFSAETLGALLTGAGFEEVETEETLGGFGLFGRARKSAG